MRHSWVLRIPLLLACFVGILAGADAQTETRAGQTYDLVEFQRLVTTNGAWGWEVDGPTLFAGRTIVTMGWLNSLGCSHRYDGSLSNPEDQNGMFTTDAAQVRLDWSDYDRNNRDVIRAECDEFVVAQGIDRPVEILVLIFGEVRNGTGRNQLYCNQRGQHQDYVTGCNHIRVHTVEFAGIARDSTMRADATWSALMSDAVRIGSRAAIRRVLGVR